MNTITEQNMILKEENKKLEKSIEKSKEELKKLKEEFERIEKRKKESDILKKVLTSEIGYQSFINYAKETNCEDSCYFWKDVELLKIDKITTKELFEKHFTKSNKLKISNQAIILLKSFLEGNQKSKFIFNSIQNDCYDDMKSKAFKKFCESGMGKAIIQSLIENKSTI
jgi:uncharacterized protein CbrC (UPF0167 family)